MRGVYLTFLLSYFYISVYSQSKENNIVYYKLKDGTKEIQFSKKIDIALYDNYGNQVLKDQSSILDMSSYKKGVYQLNPTNNKGILITVKKNKIIFFDAHSKIRPYTDTLNIIGN